MEKRQIKALFLDIDGTLVSFQTHCIPASAVEAIAAARRRGVKVFIATGRAPGFINNLGELQDRELIDGYVTMNGGYCYVGGAVIHKQVIPAPEVKVILDYCEAHHITCTVVDEHRICACYPSETLRQVFVEYLHAKEVPAVTPTEALQLIPDVCQLSPFFDEKQEQEVRPFLPNCEIGRWHPAFVDVSALGCNKQLGIDLMCRHFGIDVADTMAFGDGGNDIPMLRHAGIGVAMGNANDPVKAEADYVTDTVDRDGIAKALQHFELV